MIEVIQGIGDFFASIGSWVSNTISQAHDLWVQITEWVDRIKTVLVSIQAVISTIMPTSIEIIIISGIILILAICVWEIIN